MQFIILCEFYCEIVLYFIKLLPVENSRDKYRGIYMNKDVMVGQLAHENVMHVQPYYIYYGGGKVIVLYSVL